MNDNPRVTYFANSPICHLTELTIRYETSKYNLPLMIA